MSKYFPHGRHKGKPVRLDRIVLYYALPIVIGIGVAFLIWSVF